MRLKDLLNVLPNDPDIEIEILGSDLSRYCRAYMMGFHDVFNNCTVAGADIEWNSYTNKKKATILLTMPRSKFSPFETANLTQEEFEEHMRERLANHDKIEKAYEARMAAAKQKAAQRRKKREDEKIKLAADLKELEELREWKKKLLSK